MTGWRWPAHAIDWTWDLYCKRMHPRHGGHAIRRYIRTDGLHLRHHLRIRALKLGDAAEHFGQVQGLHADAAHFEQLLAIADGLERRGTRADGPDEIGRA